MVVCPPTTPLRVVPLPAWPLTVADSVFPTDSSNTVMAAITMTKVPAATAASTSHRGLFLLPLLPPAAVPVTPGDPAGPVCGRPAAAARLSVGESGLGSLGLVGLEAVTAPCAGSPGP